jgi:hypothetical protein
VETWKKVALRAAGFGAGSAVAGGIIIGACLWWTSRPIKPKPWNSKAITASFERLMTEGDENTYVFVYTLQNNTDFDYRVTGATELHLAAKLRQQNEFSFDDSQNLTTDYPIYVPAMSRVRFRLHVKYPYPVKENLDASEDEKADWYTNICRYVVKELSNLNGFVIVDDAERYQIDLPDGWAERAKHPLKVNRP